MARHPCVCRRSPDGLWRNLWLGSRGCSAVGWAGFAAGNVMRFAAMRFGAQAVLSALTSAQFCVIPAASYLLLGESVTFATIASMAVVIGGERRAMCKQSGSTCPHKEAYL